MSSTLLNQTQPVFSHMARLQALARFISSSEKDEKNSVSNTYSTESKKPNPVEKPLLNPNPINNDSVHYASTNIEDLVNTRSINHLSTGDNLKYHSHSKPIDNMNTYTQEVQKLTTDTVMGTTLSAKSAGFRYGNFSEVWFGNKLFLPRNASRRGLCVLCLNTDHTSFHAWQFDFFPIEHAEKTNANLVKLLEKLPENVYFAMVVKDDIFKNLSHSTKQFLAQVVGSKSIYNIRFRDSWAMIVYKPTVSSFQVMAESHKTIGLARVDVNINSSISNHVEPLYKQDEKPNFIKHQETLHEQVHINDTSENYVIPDSIKTEDETSLIKKSNQSDITFSKRNSINNIEQSLKQKSDTTESLQSQHDTTISEIKKVRDQMVQEETDLKNSLEDVRKELSGHLFLLKDLKKESSSLKLQIRKQIDAIRGIRTLVTENESAIQDLGNLLVKKSQPDTSASKEEVTA